jgi:UPF0716 protein FxsA
VSAPPTGRRRRPGWLRWVLGLLLVTPVVELVVALWVASHLGGWTFLLLVLAAVVGVLILVRGGPATFRRVREVARAGRPPTGELADAFLTVLGGVLLLVPGFVTDVLGLLCLIPPFRWGARALLVAVMTRMVNRATLRVRTAGGRVVPGAVIPPGDPRRPPDGSSGRHDGPRVIEGRVVDDDRRHGGEPPAR